MRRIISAFTVSAAALFYSTVSTTTLAEEKASNKSQPSAVSYFPAKEVSEAFVRGMPLLEIANYKIHASHRDEPGVVEVHTRDTDIIYMLEGEAVLVTGGTLVGGKNIQPEEIRGKDVKGGERRHISKGDVIIVPNGTPHWFKEVQGPLNYYVVKVRSAD